MNRVGAAVLACMAAASVAFAQPVSETKQDPFSERWQTSPAPAAKPAPPPPAIQLEQALYLIRSTLLTLNDANRSGNYTVLRDLASPDFQTHNSAADLARIFADLRERKFDLFGVALLAPQLSAPPQIDAENRLRLAGLFQTRPLMIRFDLLFQNVGGQWRLFGISVATPPAPVAAQKTNPASPVQAPMPSPAPPR